MNELINEEKPAAADRIAYLAEIERLFLEGLPTREIAALLGRDGNHVGRNLRELKKRWARAAARQKSILSQTQCAAVYREAMDGWRRSQKPKLTTTEQKDPEKEAVKTTTRREEGPGDKTFLQAAVASLKALRQFAAEKQPDVPAKPHEMTDREYIVLMQFLTQEQVDRLSDEQLERIREAIDNLRAEMDASRREESQQEEDRQDESPGISPAHAAEPDSPVAGDDTKLPANVPHA